LLKTQQYYLILEFDVKSTNWNRWAVGLTLKTKWNTPATFKNRVFYNITEVRADFRNYWRTRQINNKVPAHTGFIDRSAVANRF
jgi:hypothetical protein